ncbi:major facilitator transporter [Novosphingobium barchaimii LL02]|uniref:Major facilitator transporter n=1 Tax=Novosphingobium barchaimii LL02 TaxID=1114963 RepID=A0A0J7XPM3_9SPHN|nr:major facilitator transporter [Novosphingobium barchaimii LL02]
MTASGSARVGTPPANGRWVNVVTVICWFGFFSEGYDMGSLGAVLPTLMADPVWRLSAASAGLIASAALLGMAIGAYSFGLLSDRIGRRRCYLTCLALFSTASGFAALAPAPWLLGALRFVAGVGIGGIIPVCAALTTEFAGKDGVNRQFAIMYSGYSLGIFASALVSYFLAAEMGWRIVIGLGAVPLLLLPFIARALPESLVFLVRKGLSAKAADLALRFGIELPSAEQAAPSSVEKPGLRALFSAGRSRATIGFWLATFFSMILVYGLNTWLPKIMRDSGYELGSSIMFLGVFALASSAGGVILGWLADRIGRSSAIILAFSAGAVAILLLSMHWPLAVTYGVVALAGLGTVAAAVMVTSYLSSYFPAGLRATAVGCCVSFSRLGAVCGPLIGAAIVQAGLPVAWNFYAFALIALFTGASILIVPQIAVQRAH